MKSIETIIPDFTGFYHSIWYYCDSEYDLAYNDASELIDGYEISEIVDALIDVIDYKQYENDVAEFVASEHEYAYKELGYIENLEFQSVFNPKYYNFSTDKVNVKLTLSQKNIDKIQSDMQKYESDLFRMVKNEFTSRSGFMSFHSNDFYSDEWQKEWIYDEFKVSWLILRLSELQDYDLSDEALYHISNDLHLCLYYSLDELEAKIKENKRAVA